MTVADRGWGGGRGEENHDVLDVLDVANDFSGRRNFPPPPLVVVFLLSLTSNRAVQRTRQEGAKKIRTRHAGVTLRAVGEIRKNL